jgi:hypothetical protein
VSDADTAGWLGQKFQELLRQEGWDDFPRWIVELQDFDEVPLYSRYAQIDFLSHLPFPERNRLLVRTAADYLARLVTYVEDLKSSGQSADLFCMLSILDWDDWDESEGQSLLTPAMFITNPSREILSYMPLAITSSPHGELIKSWLPQGDFLVCDNALPDPRVERVYVLKPPMLPPRFGRLPQSGAL